MGIMSFVSLIIVVITDPKWQSLLLDDKEEEDGINEKMQSVT